MKISRILHDFDRSKEFFRHTSEYGARANPIIGAIELFFHAALSGIHVSYRMIFLRQSIGVMTLSAFSIISGFFFVEL